MERACATDRRYFGTGPAMQDLQGGRIDYLCEIVSTAKPQIDGGTVKDIAIMTKERSKVLPNVPTGIEQGVPNFEAYTWNAIFLPKGAPAEMVNKLNRATVEAMESPNVRQRRLGVKSELPALPSLALGSAEVTLIEMTRAFGAIAANAESVEPYAIDSISRRSGRVCAAAVGAYARPQPGCAVRHRRAPRQRGVRRYRARGAPAGSERWQDRHQPGQPRRLVHRICARCVVGVWVGNDDNSPDRIEPKGFRRRAGKG
jgi:Tripartite tricarboxylate transporter family receptor